MKILKIYLTNRADPLTYTVKDVKISGSRGELQVEGCSTKFEYINPATLMLVTTEKLIKEPKPMSFAKQPHRVPGGRYEDYNE